MTPATAATSAAGLRQWQASPQQFTAAFNRQAHQRFPITVEHVEGVEVNGKRPRLVVLQKLKGRPPLRIEGDQFPIENEVAPERGERVDDLWEALLSTFSLRENNVIAVPRFTAMQR